MAHFCLLDKNNIIKRVEVVNNNTAKTEEDGVKFLQELYKNKDKWVQTSYNKKFRKNFAGAGWIYDEKLDAFYPPQPYPSWIFNKETCLWEAPKPRPKGWCKWNEELKKWIKF